MPRARPNAEILTPPVMFVHGAGGGGWEWSVWARVFAARGWLTRSPDLMPCAEGLAATTFGDYRAQVVSECQASIARESGPIVLIGASLGGLLALSAAAEVGARALVLINTLPPAEFVDRNLDSPYPAIIPWGLERSIASTRRAMPDADDAACLFAWRRWRDESGLALGQARRGIEIERPGCPILVMASERDDDVPPSISRALAMHLAADFVFLPDSSHVGPLLGRQAAAVALRAANWLSDSKSVSNEISADP